MKGQSLLWFMLTCVWVELCFAQPAEKYYMYNGLFFEGMPPGVCSSDISAFITHEDTEGQKMIELKLQKGKNRPKDISPIRHRLLRCLRLPFF